MKITKILICLLIVAITASALFACGKDGGQTPSETKDSGKETDTGTVSASAGTESPEKQPTTPVDIISREDFFAQDQLVIYKELPELIRRNYDYKVTVTQGDQTSSIPVYNHTMEYEVSNRSIGGDLYRRFSQFAFSGEGVRVDIKVNRDFEYYSVIPSAKNFDTSFQNGIISVYLDKPDYFGIRLDDDDNSILSVFADLPEYPGDIPDKNGENVIYIEGWHDTETGILEITETNSVLYIAPGAVLNSRVNVKGENSKVLGRGVILDAFEDIYSYDIRLGGTEGSGTKLCMLSNDNVSFDGPILMDARCFNLTTRAKNVTVKNYKALSSMMTTDGITAGSVGSSYEHCWIYCGDNALVISQTEDQIYKDITIGTTCAAFFPQLKSKNILLDGIYIFRSNDGIIHNRYNSSGENTVAREVSLTLKNVDCMDCINIPHFFQGGNMGELPKTITFDGLSLPHMSGNTDPHYGPYKDPTDLLVEFTNPNSLYTENYTLNFNNVYVGGVAITAADQVQIKGLEFNNTVNFTNDGKYTPVERLIHDESYTAPGKVYIGTLQMSFKDDVLTENGSFFLPADEIAKMLRTDKALKTVEKNGIKYVNATDLTASGAAESIEIDEGNLYLTPVYSGENLLLPDEGKISQMSEVGCYQVDLVTEDNDGDYIYYLYDYHNYYTGGFSIMFTEEIKKYGAGEYEFKFRVRGSSSGAVVCTWRYDNMTLYSKQTTNEMVSSTWSAVSVKLNVTEDMLNNEMFTVAVTGSGAEMDYFCVKELELVKN